MKRQKIPAKPLRRARKIAMLCTLVVIGLLVLINSISWAVYRNRTYPRTQVMGHTIGSVAYGSLSEKVKDMNLLPDQLTFVYGDQKVNASLADLGISKDVSRTTQSANAQKSWLPMRNFLSSPKLHAPVKINASTFNKSVEKVAASIHKDPVNARLTINGAEVGIAPAVNGYKLQAAALLQAILKTLDAGQAAIKAPVAAAEAQVKADTLKGKQQELQQQINTSVAYNYEGKHKEASRTDVASWFVPSEETYTLSREKIQSYLAATAKEFGIRVKDGASVAASIEQAIIKHQSYTATLVQQTAAKTYTYCTATKGVDTANLPTLRAKLQSTYNDARGWSMGGLIEFKEVASGCNFTVWLTEASLMPTFGEICDSMWSCRVGANVVLNYDRWKGASPSWNANGGSLEEYRHMVINHETGHWLGFGHAQCSGAGQLAPVMQQQSIDLQGCSFNAWPISSELAVLKKSLGL